MTAVLNISQQNFGSSEKLSIFVEPNRLRSTGSQQFISNRLNKAGFLRQFYFGSLGRFGDFQGRSASFVIHINQIFGQTMPNRHKNLKATAQGASASTANTRNSVTSNCATVALKTKSLSCAKKDLEITKTFPTFVVPNTVDEHVNQLKYSNRFNTAGFLRQFYVSSLAVFGDIQGSSVSFVIHINQIFGLKMPNTDKNLKKTAQGASASTANTRNSVTSNCATVALKTKSLSCAKKDLEITKTFPTFVVQNVANQATKDISNRFNTAGFLVTDYLRMIGTFCKTLQRNSVLLLYTYHKFCFTKMQNVNKNLNRTAQGASASTANTRNSVTSNCATVALKTKSLSCTKKDLEITKTFPTFVVRTSCRLFESRLYIHYTAYDKAALLRRFYANSLGWFAKLQGRAASFVMYIIKICSKMRTSTNLKATAQGASASTANTRNSVTSNCATVALKTKSLSCAKKDLEITKTFPTFVVRNSQIGYPNDLHTTANKAALLRHFCLISRDCFAKTQRGVASFVTYIIKICSQMRNSANLKATAQGASASTANTRNSVTSNCATVALKTKSLSCAKKDLEITKTFPTFATRNVANQAAKDISNRINTAGFLVTDYLRMISTFRKNTKELRSFVIYIPNKFCFTPMRNVNKDLNKKTAPGASCSTANTRNSVTSTTDKSSVTQSQNSLHPIFPLKIHGNQVLPVTLISRVGDHLSVLHDGENYILPINTHMSFFENVFQAMDELMMDGVELDWVGETGRGTLVIEDNKVYLWHDYAAHVCFAHGRISEEHFKKTTQVKLY